MNEQNNNFNSQFNSQSTNPNVGGQPTQPVKNRFFSPDLFNDADVSAVGSSTSNSVNNNVISWGVGQKTTSLSQTNNHVSLPSNAEVTNLISPEQLLEEVNGTVYEVLDDEFLMEDVKQPVNQPNTNDSVATIGIQNSLLFQEAANTINNQGGQNVNDASSQFIPQSNMNQVTQTAQNIQQIQPIIQPQPDIQSQSTMQNQVSYIAEQPTVQSSQQQVLNNQQSGLWQPNNQVQDQSWKDGIGVVQPVGEDWMQQQPLSAASLGVEATNQETVKDVVEESRFFNQNINNIIDQNQQEQKQQYAMQYGNNQGVVLDDPLPEINDTSLLKQYVGDAFTKITMSPFSFPALLLGGFYFMFRKMYLLGIVVMFIEFGILNFLTGGISAGAYFVFHIVLALMVNPVYIKLAKGKVNSLKRSKKNAKKNQIELNTICMKKGGTSLLKAIILSLVVLIVEIIISITVLSNSMISQIIDFVNNGMIIQTSGKYEGTIMTSEYDVLSNMNIIVPANFKKDGEFFRYIYTSEESGVFNNCTLSIGKLDHFSSGEDFINQYIEYERIDANIGKTSSKGITWYTVTNESSVGKQFYRAADINGEVILFDFSIGADTPNGVCDAYLAEILDSITLKD